MAFDYVSLEDAMGRDGLRMVVVSNVPSPWGEAAKGLFHMKGVDWAAVRLAYDQPELKEWAGTLSAPVAFYNEERPRSGWAEILLLAERIAPEPSLLPAEPGARALTFGLGHELLGEGGLAWTRRLQAVQAGLDGVGGFPERVAGYLAKKYGYRAEEAAGYTPRVVSLLTYFAGLLKDGGPYLQGASPTAADVYLATVMALFDPLPEERCAMNPDTRTAFSWFDEATREAFDPVLLQHRDRMYAEHLDPVLKL
ncbi:MAG: hypothetical protein AAFR11_13410 [Pseudomonadota bacterium]